MTEEEKAKQAWRKQLVRLLGGFASYGSDDEGDSYSPAPAGNCLLLNQGGELLLEQGGCLELN